MSCNDFKLSNTLSSKIAVNSCSIDVIKAILSRLSRPKSLIKSPSQLTYLTSIFSKDFNTLRNLTST